MAVTFRLERRILGVGDAEISKNILSSKPESASGLAIAYLDVIRLL